MDIKTYMKKSRSERLKHIDLSSVCIPAGSKGNNARLGKENLLKLLGIDDFNGRKELIYACHMCENDSSRPAGWVCANPKHIYFGNVKENVLDIEKSERSGSKQLKEQKHNFQQKQKCYVCGAEHNAPNIKRWHNENCKHKNNQRKVINK